MIDKSRRANSIGVVTETLPNALFRVKIENEEAEILAYLSGKMRLNRIKVLIGDSVEVVTDPYGGKGRIVRRLDNGHKNFEAN
jgi:translation initiation factor IF-1